MPCHCKKCGAIVVGEFCSWCGERVTSDLLDLRRELRRKMNTFMAERYTQKEQRLSSHAAILAWTGAEDNILRHYSLSSDTPSGTLNLAYEEIPKIEERAARFYEGIMMTAEIALGVVVCR